MAPISQIQAEYGTSLRAMCISFWVPQNARAGKYAKETMSIARKFRRFSPLKFDVARPVVELDLSNRVMLAPGYYPANPSFVDTDGGRLVCIRGVNCRIGDDFRLTPTFTNGDSCHSINRFALLDRGGEVARTLPDLDATFEGVEDVRLFSGLWSRALPRHRRRRARGRGRTVRSYGRISPRSGGCNRWRHSLWPAAG
jgi:hypothetical protein